MNAVPLTLTEANQFIEKYHRHHHKVPRDKFRVGCEVGGKLVGVATVGQPLARLLCDGYTLEVTRLCTDGTKGVCSFLYSRCARIAKEMGYHKIITYILETEDGTSLKASGWHCEVEKCGGKLECSKQTKRSCCHHIIWGSAEISYWKETKMGKGVVR